MFMCDESLLCYFLFVSYMEAIMYLDYYLCLF